MVVLIIAMLSAMLSVSIAKINAVNMNSADSTKISHTAQSLAVNEESLIRSINYADLKDKTRTSVSDTGFEREVILSKESDYSKTIKSRTATINVYKGKESIPRATMHVTRYSIEKEFSGVPVGTVIAWPGTKAPTTNGVWLECNGQSCASYPALVAVLGKNTVPDYRNRFLECNEIPGTVKEAGLPNITGRMGSDKSGDILNKEPITSAEQSVCFTGAFRLGPINKYPQNYEYRGENSAPEYIDFDASRSSFIYGNSDTVQPASVTVRRFIKAS